MRMEAFSIREYASRMRSIDVAKCWPFDKPSGEDTIKSHLLPMEIKKFSWWLDELKSLHPKSQNKDMGSSKKKSSRKREPSSRKRKEDEDEDEIAKGKCISKGKGKVLKKRSILEIFAVSPQIERVMNSDGEEEDEDRDGSLICSKYSSREEINWGLKGKRNENNKKKKEYSLLQKMVKAKKLIKKTQIKKKKVYNNMDLLILDEIPQENHSNYELQSEDEVIRNQNALPNKMENHPPNRASGQKRKSKLKHSDANKRAMTGNFSKLITVNEEPNCASLLQSTQCHLQENIQVNHCSNQKADEHISYLENHNGTHDPHMKSSLTEESLNVQNICVLDTDSVVDHAPCFSQDSSALRTSGSKDISSNRTESILVSEAEQLTTTPCCILNSFTKKPEKVETFTRLVTSELKRHSINEETHDQMNDFPHRFFPMPEGGCNDRPNVNPTRYSSSNTCKSLVKDMGPPDPRFPQVCFGDYPKACNELPWDRRSRISELEQRAKRMPQASPNGLWLDKFNVFLSQSVPHLSPNQTLSSLCPLPNGNQTGSRIHIEKSVGVDFVGLPLNSHGELVALNSNSKLELEQMMKSRNTIAPTASLFRPTDPIDDVHRNMPETQDEGKFANDWLNLFPVENPSVAHINDRLYNMPTSEEQNQFHVEPEIAKLHSRMRLMGKELTVGFQGMEDRHVWKDRLIFEDLRSGKSNLTKNDWREPESRNQRETLFWQPAVAIHHTSGSTHALHHIDTETSLMQQHKFLTRKNRSVQKSYPIYSSRPSAVDKSNPFLSIPIAGGYESHTFGPHRPVSTISRKNSSPAQLRNKQNMPRASRPGSCFSFMPQDLQSHPEYIQNRSPSEKASSVFDASMRGSYFQMGNSHHPCVMPAANQSIDSSTFLMPEGFRMYSLAPSSLTQRPLVPVFHPDTVHMSALQMISGNQKQSDRIMSENGVSRLDHVKKAIMQNPPTSTIASEPSKMASLRFQEISQCGVVESTRGVIFEGTMQRTLTEPESCFSPKTVRTVSWGGYGDDTGRQMSLHWDDSLSLAERSGPIKLTARTKHILKACQQTDPIGALLTDPDVALPPTMTGFRF